MSRGYATAYSLYDYKGKLTNMSINLDDYFRIGVLSSPHGVKGEISVYPTSDDLDRYAYLDECYMLIKGELKMVHVTSCKFKKGMPVLGFAEYKDRDAIEVLRNVELYVDREHAVPLEEGEFYLSDIIGFEAHFHGQRIGIIEDYMENEADQTIFICKCDDGSTKYILDLPDFVEGVDLEAGIVHVNILEGM